MVMSHPSRLYAAAADKAAFLVSLSSVSVAVCISLLSSDQRSGCSCSEGLLKDGSRPDLEPVFSASTYRGVTVAQE
jgi:hypothetical protein